jgi:hypothetical protein
MDNTIGGRVMYCRLGNSLARGCPKLFVVYRKKNTYGLAGIADSLTINASAFPLKELDKHWSELYGFPVFFYLTELINHKNR